MEIKNDSSEVLDSVAFLISELSKERMNKHREAIGLNAISEVSSNQSNRNISFSLKTPMNSFTQFFTITSKVKQSVKTITTIISKKREANETINNSIEIALKSRTILILALN